MMKRLTPVALLMLVGVSVATTADAQAVSGDAELGFSASFTHYTDGADSDGSLVADVRYARFLTDAFQLGGSVTAGGPIDDLDELVLVGVYGAYHFSPAATSTWYAKGGYLAVADDPGKGFLDLAGGFKSYFKENVAFFWEAGYGFGISSDVDGGIVRSTTGLLFTF